MGQREQPYLTLFCSLTATDWRQMVIIATEFNIYINSGTGYLGVLTTHETPSIEVPLLLILAHPTPKIMPSHVQGRIVYRILLQFLKKTVGFFKPPGKRGFVNCINSITLNVAYMDRPCILNAPPPE